MNLKNNQKGMTLIEVMVSVTLGLMFLTAAMGFLITSQQSSQSQDTGNRMQENARFAMELIRESVRMAGFTQGPANPGYIYRDACGTVNGLAATNCSDDVATTATSQGDRLALAMTSPDSQDCLGNDTGSTDTVFANVFWVETSGNISSLYCRGYDMATDTWIGAAQPLIDGIDQMQVQYGILDVPTNTVDRYLNATQVQALGANTWDNVRSVKVGLLVSSGVDTNEAINDGGTVGAALASTYTNFTILDGSYTRADRKLRRVYTSLITLNNVGG